ncbi:MAG: T9SS type A sorting domain-containing protein, partial [Bacteroidota bacterium]
IADRAIEDLGTFSNSGTISGNAPDIVLNSNLGGSLSPGFSPGTIGFDGSQAFAAGATLTIEVDGTGSGEGDLVTAEGNLDRTNLSLEVMVNYTPTVGDEITIISAGSLSGDFAAVSLPPSWVIVEVAADVVIRFELPDLVWTGNVSSAWENPANWEPQIVPTFDYNVIIPDVNTNDPLISSAAVANCRSILLEEGGALTVLNSLNIDGALNTAFTVSGSLTNDAQIQIFDAGQHGISITSTGSILNLGTILHEASDNITGDAIRNAGTFNNSSNLNIQQAGDDAIVNLSAGIFNNNGTINVGTTANITGDGIENSGQFFNLDFATTNINFVGDVGIRNLVGGQFTNSNNINLGQAAGSFLSASGIDNNGVFTNTDLINIDNVGASGIVTFGSAPTASFSNAGTINIGQNFNNAIGASGFSCLGNTTNTGTINLDNANSSNLFIVFSDGIFNNEGQLYIGQNSPVGGEAIGVGDNGSLINASTGLIDIKRTDFGIIDDGGTTVSNAGQIFFDEINFNSIFSFSSFTNTGLIGGNVADIFIFNSIGGTFSPGFSPGTIAFDGNQSFLNGTEFIMEVEGTAGGEADVISVIGDIDLTNVNLDVIVNYTPVDGDEITIIATTLGVNGNFASVNLPPNWEVFVSGTFVIIRFETPSTFTWTGAVSSEWDNPNNWDALLVPTETSDVIIPNVNTNVPIIDGAPVTVKSIEVQVGSSLTVAGSNNSLKIDGADGVGMTIGGIFTVGEFSGFEVITSVDEAVVVSSLGTLTNNGFINIGTHPNASIGGTGLRNMGGTVNNELGAELRVENVQTGIFNADNGNFNNNGSIFFDVTGPDVNAIVNATENFINNGTLGGNANNINLGQDIGGTLAPGFSPGLMTFESSQRFLAGALLRIEVEGTAQGEADRLLVNGVINLNNLDLEVTVNYAPQDGDRIDIINAAVFAGSFNSVSLPAGWVLNVGPSVFIRYNVALPVEFTDFEARKMGDQVALSWQTATETNNQGFYVEHATDGRTWQELGFIAGAGTTRNEQSYSFIHRTPGQGENYYRLRQVDFDGQFDYSSVRIVQFDDGANPTISLFPNPVHESATIDLPAEHPAGELFIYDVNGRIILQQAIPSNQERLPFNLAHWPAGQYVARIRLGHRQHTLPFLRQ